MLALQALGLLAVSGQEAPTLGRRAQYFCLGKNDFSTPTLKGVQWDRSGWTITGDGDVHGLATFNIMDGYVEFIMDTTGASDGIANTFYTSSPDTKTPVYCDASGTRHTPLCPEMDIVQNNGNCESQTSWHVMGSGGSCDTSDKTCSGKMGAHGKRVVRADFPREDRGVVMHVSINGKEIDVKGVGDSDKSYLRRVLSRQGVKFHSSQYKGSVPDSSKHCPMNAMGNITESTFSVSDIIVYAPRGIRNGEATECTTEELEKRQQAIKATSAGMPTPAPTPLPSYPYQWSTADPELFDEIDAMAELFAPETPAFQQHTGKRVQVE